jgi:uncharacterized protein YecE (DUF72 family)
LPARFKADADRLKSFFKMLSRKYRYAFEFRDASWYTEEIFKLLRKRNVALCISDHVDAPAPWEATADFVYVRGHGPTREYHTRYGTKALHQWAATINGWKRKGLEVFCYFDNDQKSAAPWDARQLSGMVNGRGGRKTSRRRSKK